MKNHSTITTTEMRGVNRTAILDIIRRKSPISRLGIAQELNVSLPTVMRIVDEFLEEKLVRYSGEKDWSGGRKRPLIEFNATENLSIGIDLGGTKFYGAVADLGGKILHEMTIDHNNSKGEASYAHLIKLVDILLCHAHQSGQRIRGIGVGVPGVTYHEEGVVEWAPSLEWRDFHLKEKLNLKYHLPVIVDNDVSLSALGELWFEAGQNARNLVLITIGTGIGAGVIIDGMIYRGSHNAAGEVGYLLPTPSFLNHIYEGFGALEQIASGLGIAHRARNVLSSFRSGDEVISITAEDVFASARDGDIWALEIYNETVDYLAQLIVTISLCYDPDVIILGGGMARYADLLIDSIRKRIEGKMPFHLNLLPSALGPRAAVMGAIISLLQTTSNLYVVRKLS